MSRIAPLPVGPVSKVLPPSPTRLPADPGSLSRRRDGKERVLSRFDPTARVRVSKPDREDDVNEKVTKLLKHIVSGKASAGFALTGYERAIGMLADETGKTTNQQMVEACCGALRELAKGKANEDVGEQAGQKIERFLAEAIAAWRRRKFDAQLYDDVITPTLNTLSARCRTMALDRRIVHVGWLRTQLIQLLPQLSHPNRPCERRISYLRQCVVLLRAEAEAAIDLNDLPSLHNVEHAFIVATEEQDGWLRDDLYDEPLKALRTRVNDARSRVEGIEELREAVHRLKTVPDTFNMATLEALLRRLAASETTDRALFADGYAAIAAYGQSFDEEVRDTKLVKEAYTTAAALRVSQISAPRK